MYDSGEGANTSWKTLQTTTNLQNPSLSATKVLQQAATQDAKTHHLKTLEEERFCSKVVLQRPSQNGSTIFKIVPSTLVRERFENGIKLLISKNIDIDITIDESFDDDLIDFYTECEPVDKENKLKMTSQLRNLNTKNHKLLRKLLVKGLENVRLLKEDISLKINFGHIYYPTPIVNFGQEKSYHVINSIISGLSPCDIEMTPYITNDGSTFNNLIEYFKLRSKGLPKTPDVYYTIETSQYIFQKNSKNNKTQIKNEPVAPTTTITTVKFSDQGSVESWNSTVDKGRNAVSFMCANLESDCDYNIQLQVEHNVSSHAQSKFVNSLAVGSTNKRLRFHGNSRSFAPKKIVQTTKWTFTWKGYDVDIAKDEIWLVYKIIRFGSGTYYYDLATVPPDLTGYRASLSKESWKNQFSQNKTLYVGEEPKWTTQSFLGKRNEEIQKLMNDANKFTKILNKFVFSPWNAKS